MTKTNKEIIQEMYDAMAVGDLDTMMSYLHDSVVVEEAESMPYSGLWEGKDKYMELVQRVGTTWDEVNFNVKTLVADGDHVIALSELTGVGKNSRQPFATSLAEVFVLDGGKVKHVKPYYFDTQMLSGIH
ncbi:MAG: nuclear transport factor 2 family protein [bacterium]